MMATSVQGRRRCSSALSHRPGKGRQPTRISSLSGRLGNCLNEYDRVSIERIADHTKIAVLLDIAPGMIRDLLLFHIGSIGNNSQLRDLLRLHLVNTAAYDGTSIRIGYGTSASGSTSPPRRKFRDPALMEIDAITNGKSKGKGELFKGAKGKGNYDGNFGKGHWKGGDGRGDGGPVWRLVGHSLGAHISNHILANQSIGS